MTQFKNLKEGHSLSETQYYKVAKISGDRVQLKTDSGENIVVDKAYVESFLTSADQFTETTKVTRTELAEMLISNPNVVMTVNFNKQVKEADVAKEIQEAYENSTPKEFATKMKKAIKAGLNGEQRTMVGRHSGNRDDFGRVHFVDMNIDKDPAKPAYDSRMRLVDPRTINWLILRGTRYEAK